MTEPVRTDPGRDRRRRRGGWLWWLLLLLAVLIALIIVLAARGCGDDDNGGNTANGNTTNANTTNANTTNGNATNANPTNAGATTSSSGGGTGTGASGASGNGSGSAGSAGVLTSQSTNLLGRSPSTLARFVGKPVAGRAVKVVSVVGDEVFWVGSSKSDRVLVHLRTSGESPPKVRAGDRATFTGALAKNAAGAAGSYGVTEREGAALLKRQGVHVETNVSTLKLTHS